MKTSRVSTRLLFAPLLAAFLLPAAALAGGDKFESMDTNSDGYLDMDEMSKAQDQKFEKMDSDSNGSISEEEWTKAGKEHSMGDRMKSWVGMDDEKKKKMKQHKQEMFSKMDSDGDGMLTKDELESSHQMMMDKADKDGDGRISRQEYEQKHEKMKQKMKDMKHGGEERMLDQRKQMDGEEMMDPDTPNGGY